MKKKISILRSARKLKAVAKASAKRKISKVIVTEGKQEIALLKKLHRISINARRKAHRRKAAVTIIRDGKIIKVYPGKRERTLGTITKVPLPPNLPNHIKLK